MTDGIEGYRDYEIYFKKPPFWTRLITFDAKEKKVCVVEQDSEMGDFEKIYLTANEVKMICDACKELHMLVD